MTPRLNKHPMLAMFDGADANVTTVKRGESTVPLQSLFVINGEFVSRQSIALADRVLATSSQDSPSPADELAVAFWKRTLGRVPTDAESAAVAAYVNEFA